VKDYLEIQDNQFSNKNYAINKHASWQQSFNKRTLGATLCNNCSTIDCANNFVNCVSNTDNSCQWKCSCGGIYFFYCNGTPPQSPI